MWQASAPELRALGYPVSLLTPNECSTMVGLAVTDLVRGGSLRPMGALFQPLRLFDVLLEDALAQGAHLVTQTRVHAWRDGPAGITVDTSAGVIEAGHLVLACNGGLHELAPRLAPDLVPSKERVAVVRFSRPNPITIGFGIDWGRAYGCMIDDDRALVGGIAIDETPTVASLAKRLAPFIQAPPIQAVESDWVGSIVDTRDERPLIGRYAPRVWIASAYGGQALPFLLTTGDLMSAAIAGDDDSAIPVILRPTRFLR